MKENNHNSSAGTNVLGLLGVAFVVLKLTGVIDWSWWWVTAPFWGGVVLILLFISVWFVFFYGRSIFKRHGKRRGEQHARDFSKL